MIDIGSNVKVIRPGSTYSTYKAMAKHMGLTKWVNSEGVWDYLPKKDRTYRVIAKARHGDDNTEGVRYNIKVMLYGIEDIDTGMQYVIGKRGVIECPIDLFTMEDFEI